MVVVKKLNYCLYELTSKKLKIGISFFGGRNFTGQICVHNRSGEILLDLYIKY